MFSLDNNGHHGDNIFKTYSLEITILVAAILISSSVLVSFNGLAKQGVTANVGGANLGTGAASGTTPAGGSTGAQGGQTGGQLQNIQVDIGDAPTKGSATAPVTIIEFEDPSCPYCAAAHGKNQPVIDYLRAKVDPNWQAPMPSVITDYVATGKVKLVYKFFPGHGNGEEAMKILWCSNEQGGSKFWDLLEDMYAHQDLMEAHNITGLKALATAKGVDSAALETCYSSGKYDARLVSETNQGRTAAITGTPGFIVNGKLVEGAVSYPTMKRAIDAAIDA